MVGSGRALVTGNMGRSIVASPKTKWQDARSPTQNAARYSFSRKVDKLRLIPYVEEVRIRKLPMDRNLRVPTPQRRYPDHGFSIPPKLASCILTISPEEVPISPSGREIH